MIFGGQGGSEGAQVGFGEMQETGEVFDLLFFALRFVLADVGQDVGVGVDFVNDITKVVLGGVIGVEVGYQATFVALQVGAHLLVVEVGPGALLEIGFVVGAIDEVALMHRGCNMDDFVDYSGKVFVGAAKSLAGGVFGERFVVVVVGLVEGVQGGGGLL